MRHAVLKKDKFEDFIIFLLNEKKVMAPVSKGTNNYQFDMIGSPEEICMDYIPTILPPKKYFSPQLETLVEYDTHEGQKMEAVVEVEELVLFGVHTCDIAGIQCLNVVFSDRPRDLNYLVRKNYITIIGLECNKICDEYSSCSLMDNYLPKGGYDLFMTDLDDYYMISINTQRGEDIVRSIGVFEEAGEKHLAELKAHRAAKKDIFKNDLSLERAQLPTLLEKGFESKIWEEVGARCLSCANCTNVCPTCYCFDVKDVPNLDLKTGKRIRVWDSCQNEPFARVAGGESFRENRKDRKRHRFNRKFNYPMKRYGRFFCTGCGRCSRTCMAEINLKETIQKLAEEIL